MPPRLARALLLLGLPAATRRAAVDDLDEEFRRFIAPHRSRLSAAAWYWRQVLASLGPALVMRARVIRSVPGDVRYGVRVLAQRPGFTAASILVLGLGVGASSAVLSVVEAVLLRPLDYARPDRLAVVLHQGRNPVSPRNFLEWQRQTSSFSAMGAAEYWTTTMSGVKDGEPDRVSALKMTADVLPMLGVPPALGRTWTIDEENVGDSHVVVIGHGLWQRRFGGDPVIVNKTVLLDGVPFTVIGVMPDGFAFAPFWATRAEFWASLSLASRGPDGGESLRVFARLKDGVTLSQAREEIATLTSRLERERPGSNRDVRVIDLTEKVVGDVRTPLLLILGAVGFVLLLACANIAHMLLAQAVAREREMAVRAALGATRGRLVRQLLTESLVLASLGGLVGLGLARAGIQLLVVLGASSLPRSGAVGVNGWVLAASAAITCGAGLIFGLVAARRVSGRLKPAPTRPSSARITMDTWSTARTSAWTRHLIIASEMALALMLLVGAGLLARSFAALQSRNLGFAPDGVLTFELPVTGTSEAAAGRRETFYKTVLERVRQLPGVRDASGINHLPLGGDSWGWPFRVGGKPEPAPGDLPVANYKAVLPGYFRTMRMTLVAGRDVADQDRLGTPGVVVINQFLAEHHWPGANPIGQRITLDSAATPQPQWLTVIGVVGNTIHSSLSSPPEDELFLPLLQRRHLLENPGPAHSYLSVAVRCEPASAGPRLAVALAKAESSCDASSLTPAIRGIVRSLNPHVPVAEVKTMTEYVDEASAQQRFYLVLIATFAVAALVLAAVGIYGVMSHAVAHRTREIGLRIALGARPSALRRRIVLEAMSVAMIGAVIGGFGAAALSGVISSLLFSVGPRDVATYTGVAALLGTVAFVACYLPARRATLVDPLTALRD